jgi:hypothetical protein
MCEYAEIKLLWRYYRCKIESLNGGQLSVYLVTTLWSKRWDGTDGMGLGWDRLDGIEMGPIGNPTRKDQISQGQHCIIDQFIDITPHMIILTFEDRSSNDGDHSSARCACDVLKS